MQESKEYTTQGRRWTIILLAICLLGLMLIVIFVPGLPGAPADALAILGLYLIPATIASALIGAILGLIISVFSRQRARRDVFRRGRRGALIGMTAAIATAATTIVTFQLFWFNNNKNRS